MKRVMLFGVVLALVAMAGCGGTGTATQEIANVTSAQAADLVQQGGDLVILDIRTPEEYAGGKIDGAVNVDFYAADFADRLSELNRDTHYLVYCRTGNRTNLAIPIFEELGFARVDNLTGGIVDWFEQGYPVVP